MIALLRRAPGICLLLVAIVTGVISAGYPVALLYAGFDKPLVVAFFVINSVAAFTAATASVRLTDVKIAARLLPGALTLSAVGLAGVAWGRSVPVILVGGALSMSFVVATPFVVRLLRATNSSGTDAAWSAAVRWISVLGYVLGIAAFGIMTSQQSTLRVAPLVIAVGAMVAAILPAVFTSRSAVSLSPPEAPRKSKRNRRSISAHLVAAITVVVLLKAADSLRLVYLPLYIVASGWDPIWISVFFVLTAAIELAILPLVGRLSGRFRTRDVLACGAVLGVGSFAVTAGWGTLGALVAAQVFFAIFTAVYQAVSPVVLGEMLDDGLASGTGLFAGLLQVGSLVGVVAPLGIPGYNRSLFWIAAALCAVPALLLVTLLRKSSRNSIQGVTAVAAPNKQT